MVLRGDIEKPSNFTVVCADPGMEDPSTVRLVKQSMERCKAAGITFLKAEGPNLYEDLIFHKVFSYDRIDNPPYWTKDKEGKRGRLLQKCTHHYKIAPMRRAIRAEMKRLKIPVTPGAVESWIGFALDEWHRCSDSDVAYTTMRFPLIELKLDRMKVEGYYLKNGIPKPRRSVCAACFSNGLSYYKELSEREPEHFSKAIEIDEVMRDLSCYGVRDTVFVSPTLLPLRDIAAKNFLMEDEDMTEHHCNSGVCFL